MKNIVWLFLILFFCHKEALCQPVPNYKNSPFRHCINVSIGFEPELITTIAYRHHIKKEIKGNSICLGPSVKLAPMALANSAWRMDFAALFTTPVKKSINIFSPAIYLARNRDRAAKMTGIGFEFRDILLVTGSTWDKGIEASWQFVPFTRIKHSLANNETYDDRYENDTSKYQQPRNGWYAASSSRFRLGFLASKGLSSGMSLQLGIGTVVSYQKQKIFLAFPYAQVPVYFTGTFAYSW
jgi:hypothetical protein